MPASRDPGGFASLPGSIRAHLESGGYDRVVFLLIDGFGWRFFEKFQEHPFLKRISRVGKVEKIRSQFPSTTAAHITTIHTGLPVGEHGVFEWYYYEPGLDAVIAPLLFSHAGVMERDTLRAAGVKPSALYPRHTLYQALGGRGVHATIFQHREYTPSTYSNAMFRGAEAIGYKTLPEGLVNVVDALSTARTPAYFFLYFDRIDAICHEYGPAAPQTEAEVVSLLLILEHILQEAHQVKGRTLFLLSADHGQVEVDPATTVYLNTTARFEGFTDFLRMDARGGLIVPAGSCRDFFLYIQPGRVDEAQAFLASRLEGQAEVRRVEQMASEGWFGPSLAPIFRQRAGDLVILPYAGESVWWYEKDHYFQKYRGHHGGLTAAEMEIPLLTWEM